MSETLQPCLKWAGSKRWAVPLLREIYAPHHHLRLVEPFVGGMSVALGLAPARALLADVNPYLINFHECVRLGLRCSLPMRNEEAYYYGCRSVFNEIIRSGERSGPELAELFYYLNRTGYNGLCRFNKKFGTFNVPFGKYATINYLTEFKVWAEATRGWELRCSDFEQLALQFGDFLYADSPYDGSFSDYSEGGFTWEDQERLAKWLARHTGPVVASNKATERILVLYRGLGFNVVEVDAPRSISSDGDRAPVREIIATKNFMYHAQAQIQTQTQAQTQQKGERK